MEILTKNASEDLLGKIKGDVKRIDDGRVEWKRQAIVNVMFLYGRHHFSLYRSGAFENSLGQRIAWELEALKRNNSIRRTSNYILPLFRSIYSRLIRMKANIYAEPDTSTEGDRDAAIVTREVLEQFWKDCNKNNPWMENDFTGMQSVIMRATMHMMTLGSASFIPYFNPKATVLVYDEMRKDIIEAAVGEAEVRVVSPLDTFRDRFNRYYIERRILCPEQVEYEFDQKVEPSSIDNDSVETQIRRLLEGSNTDEEMKDGVTVYTKYCNPSSEYPNGRIVSCTDSKILYEGELPQESKNKIPVVDVKYQDLGFSTKGQGCLEQVVDLQQDYNFTLTRIAQYKKLLVGKIFAPYGSKMSQKWDDEIGQIIHYNQGLKPSQEAGVSIPTYLTEELARIRKDMEDLMNAHDPSLGRAATPNQSGIAIQSLNEMDNSMISPELIMYENKLGFLATKISDICQFRYNERRLLSIAGDDLAYEIKSFIGSDLFGQKRVHIRMGSNMPLDPTARMNYILMLRKEGLISPEKEKELLEFDDVEGAFGSLDETAAKQDILNTIEGSAIVQAELWEDHTIHLKVINDFRKGIKYQKLSPEIRQRIDMLAQEHQDLLLQEMAASGGKGALPPAAAPQVNGAQ